MPVLVMTALVTDLLAELLSVSSGTEGRCRSTRRIMLGASWLVVMPTTEVLVLTPLLNLLL